MTDSDQPTVPVEVLASYDLLPEQGWRIRHVRTLHNSVFSVSHRSAAEPAWALRRHGPGWRSAGEIRAELAMLEFLDQRLPDPITVPRPGRTSNRALVVEADGSLYSLLGWISGAPARPDTGLDTDAVKLLGRGLGALHTALDQWPASAPRWDGESLLSDSSPGLMGKDSAALRVVLDPADLALFAEVADRTREVFARSTDWGLIHGDYILGNCHWSSVAGRRHLGILDFDDFGFGPRPYDLGAALGNLADFHQTWPDHAAAFVAGYRTEHELPNDLVAALPIMMAARHASMCL
ncbi:MAG: phosphotransferase, partial [Microlunatus sp.]|nr:phosphotransferase [Microlunatus sp.]